MPLDDLKWAVPRADTPLARRRRLIESLRNDPQPWDFRYHATCAMGLAVRLGIASSASHDVVGDAIGIGADAAWRLFRTSRAYRKPVLRFFARRVSPNEVTPLMVADALEQISG